MLHSYRKIPGDKCEGGTTPERSEIDLSQRCVSDLVGPQLLVSFGQPENSTWPLQVRSTHSHLLLSFATQTDTSTSKSVPIVVTVVIIMLLSVAGGVLFVKKYVCGGRLDVILCSSFCICVMRV